MLFETIKRIKFAYSSKMAREPLLAPLYWPNIWRQQYKIWRYYRDKGASLTDCFVHRYTEIVLDGCQGSANSYAADVFLRSQKRPVHMAHHMHAPAQIIKATKRNIPTLVTIRNPKATVLSLTSRWPYISVRQALKHYISFYKKLEPHRAHFILSPFEATTNHFDIAIQIINQHFGTDFDLISEQVLLEMRERHSPGDSTPESRKRLELKKRKEKELLNPRCKPLIKSAELLYDRLVRHELTV